MNTEHSCHSVFFGVGLGEVEQRFDTIEALNMAAPGVRLEAMTDRCRPRSVTGSQLVCWTKRLNQPTDGLSAVRNSSQVPYFAFRFRDRDRLSMDIQT